MLSSTSANQDILPDLIAVATSPRNVTFNQSVWNYLVGISEVICLVGPPRSPRLPPKEGDLAQNNPLLVRRTPLPHLLLPIKVFHSVQLLGTPLSLSARWDAAQLMNH